MLPTSVARQAGPGDECTQCWSGELTVSNPPTRRPPLIAFARSFVWPRPPLLIFPKSNPHTIPYNRGFNYSLLTRACVGAGTIAFFLLFQRGGPLSSVPAILAGGAAIGRSQAFCFSTNRHRGSVFPASSLRSSVCFCCTHRKSVCSLFRKQLQSDISHRMCIADNVASTGKENVEVFVQLPTATDIERQLGTATTFFG